MAWPTTDDPRNEFVTVRLTASEAADVDWLMARTNSKSRSAAVRSSLERVIARERRAEKRAKTERTE